MKTNFLGSAYASRSPILASQTAINIYPEFVEVPDVEVGGFTGTPGLQSVFQGSGEVRGLWVTRGENVGDFRLFAVIGSTVYRFNEDYQPSVLGNLPNDAGHVSMVDNGLQLAIAHQDGWHSVDLGGSALSVVNNAPANAILVGQDNYGLFTQEIGGEFGLTDLGNLSSINALDVATAEGAPDDTIAILSDHREAWLGGTNTVEIWSNTGAAFFPFERAPGGFIEQGVAARRSMVKIDNSVMWLGRDKLGKGIVYRANAYIPVRISTYAMEVAFATYPDITDAFAYGYQEEGHTFYVLTFPSGDQTWVYDVSASSMAQRPIWHQRAWQDSTGLLHRHRSNCFAQFGADNLVGDYQNGKIYRMNLNLTTDDGVPIYRERGWEIDSSENHKMRVDLLELIALTGDGDLTGSAPLVGLKMSRDAGRQFGYERFQTLGPTGQRKARARWRRPGTGRNLVCKVFTTMTSRVSWTDVTMQGEELSQ